MASRLRHTSEAMGQRATRDHRQQAAPALAAATPRAKPRSKHAERPDSTLEVVSHRGIEASTLASSGEASVFSSSVGAVEIHPQPAQALYVELALTDQSDRRLRQLRGPGMPQVAHTHMAVSLQPAFPVSCLRG